MDLGLAGATVVVQGGSRGMGRAAARAFAAERARVAVLARPSAALDATISELADVGSPDAVGIPTDIRDAASVVSAFNAVGARWGSVNALVCAVGPQVSQQPWDSVSDDQFLDAFEVGALSAVRCARAALPLLRSAEWGRIVNVSAMSARCQGHGLIEYTAAKAALTSITKNMSLELAHDGILVNTVSPGTFMSDQLVDYVGGLPAEAGVRSDDPAAVMGYISDQFGVRADLRRAGEPDEIGPAICFLASRRNSYTTGANLNVDGGSAFFA